MSHRYVREKMMAQFAEDNKLPVISDNCPACFAAPQERHRVKLLLAREEYGRVHVSFRQPPRTTPTANAEDL